jgi:hypothetical protein
LPGGSYNILITVTDGSDQRNKYLPVTLLEVPVRMDGYIVVTGQQMFESVISRLNPAFESDTQFIIPENYLLSGVHSGWGTFFFVSQAPSRLMALNTLDFEKDWEMSAEPPASLFTGIFLDDDLVFSTGNGDCGILSPDGTIILRTAPTPDKSIQLISADETFIYTSVVSSGGTVRELRVIYRVSGNARDDVPVQGEIKSLIPADGNVIVFFEINTGTRIMEYAPNDMIMTELNMLTNERIQSALKISDSEIMMLTDKNVISYDLSSSRFTAFKDQPYDFCRYERQSDRLYLVKDSTIYGFDRLSGDLVTEKSFPMKVLDFQILYNK